MLGSCWNRVPKLVALYVTNKLKLNLSTAQNGNIHKSIILELLRILQHGKRHSVQIGETYKYMKFQIHESNTRLVNDGTTLGLWRFVTHKSRVYSNSHSSIIQCQQSRCVWGIFLLPRIPDKNRDELFFIWKGFPIG